MSEIEILDESTIDLLTSKNMIINRRKLIIPRHTKNKDLLILLNTKSKDDSIKAMTDTRINGISKIKGYYIDRVYNISLFGKTYKYRINSNEHYQSIKDAVPNINRTLILLAAYNNFNSFYDMSIFNELFLNAVQERQGKLVIYNYEKILDKIIADTDMYPNRVMLINTDEWNENFKDPSLINLNNVKDPIQILLYMMNKDLEYFTKLPFRIVFYNSTMNITVIPSECDGKNIKVFMARLRKMTVKKNSNATEKELNTEISPGAEIIKQKISDKLELDTSKYQKVYAFTGDINNDDMKNIVTDTVKEIDEDDTIPEDEKEQAVEDKLNSNIEFMTNMEILKSDKITNNMSQRNIARNKMLMQKQAEVKINGTGKTIAQMTKELEDSKIEPRNLEKSVHILNADLTMMTYPNFTREFNKKCLEQNNVAILNSFKDKDLPVYVRSIKKEDTSNEFDKKYTYTVEMESGDRVRHKLVFDFPKVIDDSFLYLGGNKKSIVSQLFLKPIEKLNANTVQICTNYNKVFLTRNGKKVSPKIEKLKKSLANFKGKTPTANLYFDKGDNTLTNQNIISNMEYDELAANMMLLSLGGGDYILYFNHDNAIATAKNKGVNLINDPYMLLLGFSKKESITLYINTKNDHVISVDKKGVKHDYEVGVADFIVNIASSYISDFEKDYNAQSYGKRFIYTQAKIMAKDVPLLLLLSYLCGFTTTLKRANINCKFTDKRESIDANKEITPFADGYLIWDRYPMSNSLLMNALALIPTKNYNYADMDSKETYLDIFYELYGNRMILNAFENFYCSLIDPITLTRLKDLNLPTDFLGVFVYGNELLQDNQFIPEIEMEHYVLRNNEMFNAFLYKEISDAYARYRMTAGNKHPQKMSIPKDQIIKDILLCPNVEDYSTLNPILEAEKLRAVSFKGPNGMNQERAFTIQKRAYVNSMKGILAMSSPPTGQVGIVRQLAINANVNSVKGYLHVAQDEKELNASNLYCASELATPMTAQRDDAQRVQMVLTQSKHIIPCKDYSKPIIRTGIEKVLPHIISNDFAFKAKEDGKVVDVDEERGFMLLQYKNGEKDVVDIRSKMSKNGGGGFYISNKLNPQYKKGQSFKKDAILAQNTEFFNNDEVDSDAVLKNGTLAKIAVMSGFFTYEDSNMITQSLSKKMATSAIMPKNVVLGPNSNIEYIVKKGQKIEVGDPLIIFDESYDDEGLNKLLSNLSKDSKEDLINIGKKPIKSKYSGTVEDVKVYYTVDFDRLSPSLQKAIKQINKPTEDFIKGVNKFTDINKTNVFTEPTHKVETKFGKVKGADVGEGVYFEFYVRYEDMLGVGDKIKLQTALKTVVCDIVPEGHESYSEYRPDEEISAYLGPISILARMTASIEPSMFTNKLMIELKRQILNDYFGK